MDKKKAFGISSSWLHLIAIILMLIDHIGYVIYPQIILLRWIGRIAFPIFCFMIAEGHRKTKDNRKYAIRLLILAIASEIPFNLMTRLSIINSSYQNVIWTLLIGLIVLNIIDWSEKNQGDLPGFITKTSSILCGYAIANLMNTDYGGDGVLIVLLFGIFYKDGAINKVIQAIGLFIISGILLGGFNYTLMINDEVLIIPMEIVSMLSLPLIWLYNGDKGYSKKWFKWFTYSFYPIHMLIISILGIFM